MHRTANGRTFDMNALRQKNEHVRAVGNMNVNSRGDTIDSNNQVIDDHSRRINQMYNKTIQRQGISNQPQQVAQPVNTDLYDDFDEGVVYRK